MPNLADILSDQACQFLRRNITNGAYNSVDHYLDVQFRLLREDFLQPLRDGVHELREIIREARLLSKDQNQQLLLNKQVKFKISRIQSLSVYFDCLLEGPFVTDQGIIYQVRLSSEKAKAINWDASKKLLYGSLVCLSDEYFEKTCLVATICERDPRMLKQGIVMIKLDENKNKKQIQPVIVAERKFIMLETSAFFESYKHVLNALISFKHDGEENFPFRENLVYCQNRSMPIPEYLTTDYIDFS